MRFRAMLAQRCPHCLEGKVFATFWRMNERCPVCAIRFEREPGYFLMAMFVGYMLGLGALAPVALALYFSQASPQAYIIAFGLTLAVVSPLVFRYARVIWMHIDELLDPRPPGDNSDADHWKKTFH
jgi:uncharacterized protein (DUF983 family)